MDNARRMQWVVGIGIFLSVFIVFGATFYTSGVFLLPLTRYFHWTRAVTSTLFMIAAIAGTAGNLLAGWLLDRVNVKPVMATGVAITGISFVLASQATSYWTMAIAYAAMGIGMTSGTLLPAVVLITRTYEQARGTILGLVMAGESAGGVAMTILSTRVLTDYDWRAAYISLAVPCLVLALPIVLLMVQDLPLAATAEHGESAFAELDGLEVGQAIRTRSFWLIGFAYFGATFGLTGEIAHVFADLRGLGYSVAVAAAIWSVFLGLKSAGQLGFGVIADWITARIACTLGFIITGVGIALLTLASHSVLALVMFVILGGFPFGIGIVLQPMVQAESMGLKRFGSIQGILFTFSAFGSILGPVVVASIFDATRSYNFAFWLTALLWVLAGLAIYGCVPLSSLEPVGEKRVAPMKPRLVATKPS